MAPLSAVLWSGCLALLTATATASFTPRHDSANNDNVAQQLPLAPDDAAIRRNAFSIFNSVHSAMRQWGSSLNHNGMSLMLGTVPEGELFYHGGPENERPKGLNGSGFDWLAFELEHAQMFAQPLGRPPEGKPGEGPPGEGPPGEEPPAKTPGGTPGGPPGDKGANAWEWDIANTHYERQVRRWELGNSQKTLRGDDDNDNDDNDDKEDPRRPGRGWAERRGYFHTYRANRPLNLLYIDGMAAGKTGYGCLDTQDLLLLDLADDDGNNRSSDYDYGGFFFGELDRAGGLCDLAKKWAWADGRIDGFIRTEAGFEIIYCDFGEGGGLDVVTIQPAPFANQTGGVPQFVEMEFMRGVSLRYHGFPAGRIHMDWSSMVSAFFYDVNLTNPDATRPELPRLASTTRSERRSIRARVEEVVAVRGRLAPHHGKAVVDWQGIVDLVVTRFSQRLDQLARDKTASITSIARQMLPTVIYAYINFEDPAESRAVQMQRCTQHYLAGALALQSTWTPEDQSIFLAVETVTGAICQSWFGMYDIIYNATANGVDVETTQDQQDQQDRQVREIVDDLMKKLQWTTWRQCDPCQNPNELCLVAMFPWGDDEDHFHPRCKTVDDLVTRHNYWENGMNW